MSKTNRQISGHHADSLVFRRKVRRIWRIAASIILVLWTIWTLLDAFVIPRDIIHRSETNEIASGLSTSQTEDPGVADGTMDDGNTLTEPVITDTSYEDGHISIQIRTMRRLDTDIYIADIVVDNPDLLQTALAGDAFGRNLTDTTSSIAEANNAVLAINGDYYGFRDAGYVMRGGYLYRDLAAYDQNQEDLCIMADGTLEILAEVDYSAQDMADMGARDIFSFGPGLLIDGEITVREGDEVERAQVTNPRTSIGQIAPLHYVFVVSDGRTEESVGLSLLELAQLMQDLGCTTAYNLDGGGSSTIWFNGRVLNKPTTFGEKITERSISDIVYIGE
ncbi:MAG: phosphodiester glycosidase family protein [Lachnospiraceae bacterium]|nr:phosphodiester glycosidase family protein [Lachnospiraceae bacterium]